MEYIQLNNGINMPLVGLGTWELRDNECIKVVKEAIECGYRLIDTAQMYDNEIEVGQGIKESGIDRKELFITTKLYEISNSYQKAKQAIEQSLKNLQLDYIDLILLHEPYSNEEGMYQALEEAYQEGKVKAIGISNYHDHCLDRLLPKCHIIPMVNQVECNIFYQKEIYLKQWNELGIVMQAWSPLAQGKKKISNIPILKNIAKKYHKTEHQICLRFLIQRGISVVPKTKHKERLIQNIDLFDFELTNEEMDQIRSLDENKTLFGWTTMF